MKFVGFLSEICWYFWISSLFLHRRFWKSSSVFTRCISKFCKLSNHGSLDSSSGWHLWKYEKLKNWKNRYWISKLDYGMGWVFGVWAAPVGAASLLLLSLLYNCHRLDPCSGGGDQYPHPPWLQLRVCPPLPLTTLHFTILQHCIVVFFLSHNHRFASCRSHCSLHSVLSVCLAHSCWCGEAE